MVFIINRYIKDTRLHIEGLDNLLKDFERYYASSRAKAICGPIVASLIKLKEAHELFIKEAVEARTKLEEELDNE